MGSKVILIDREDIRKIEGEEKYNFIITILLSLGLPEERIEACYPADGEELSVQNKMCLRKLCQEFQITIVDDLDGGVKIYVTSEKEKTLIAEWKKCWYALRVDLEELDRSKRIFAELHANWWSLFEDENG